MNLWKILGFASGILLISVIARRRRERTEPAGGQEKLYDTEDLLTDQEL